MSSQQFEYKKDDFESQISSFKRKLDRDLPNTKGEDRKRLLRELERGSEDATILVHEMEEEMRKAPPGYRTQLQSQLRTCQRTLDAFTRDLNRANTNGSRPRGFDPEDDFGRMEDAQRARLLQGTESMNRASESVARSQRIAAETDEIGEGIIDELGEQRESLVRTRDRLVETQSNLARSRKILQSMGRRLITNKLLLVIIIFLEVCILGAVIYWKFHKFF